MLNNLVKLNLPDANLKLARKEGQVVVWDPIRKKHLVLTPEEWVRQHFIHYLIALKYPETAIALEGGFHLGKKLQRTDILIYQKGKPAMIVECKAPQVKLNQTTFDQALRYNTYYNTGHIVVTNGLQHHAARVNPEQQNLQFLTEIPAFNEL